MDCTVVLFIIVLGTSTLFSVAAVPVCILTSSMQCLNFSTSSPILVICFFSNSYLTSVRWYFIVVLTCISLIIAGVEHFSHLPAGHRVFFGEMFVRVLSSFLTGLFVCLLLSCSAFSFSPSQFTSSVAGINHLLNSQVKYGELVATTRNINQEELGGVQWDPRPWKVWGKIQADFGPNRLWAWGLETRLSGLWWFPNPEPTVWSYLEIGPLQRKSS